MNDMKDDHYFVNFYPYGIKPYWTMHASPDIARADAREGVLHIAVPVRKDGIIKPNNGTS